MRRAVGVDRAHRMPELVDERQVAGTLEDLKGLTGVGAAQRPEGEALVPRVGGGARGEVPALRVEAGGRVRDGAALDDAEAWRRILPRAVRLDVEAGAAQGLPDAGEVGP